MGYIREVIKIITLEEDEISGTLDHTIEYLHTLRTYLIESGYTNIKFTLGSQYSDYDTTIEASRPETDEECKYREEKGGVLEAQEKKLRYAKYLDLKEEFDKDSD